MPRTRNTVTLPNGKRYICRIYDNGGDTADRYTICYKAYRDRYGDLVYPFVGCSADPFNGFGVHGESLVGKIDGKHLGKRVRYEDLPEPVQRLIRQDLIN